ncbi:MAG TPA: DUF1028 domain-containing protein [Solirubrobacteraceae bacterium]|nr:DUF1028 domain-containing protein [Solirubrobacteraceae bacterium]
MRIGTYSIVARDAATGALGVAVQSHWFAVGPIVPWARAGVGAVATQSIAEPAYGPRLLDRLEDGTPAHEALADLLAQDPSAHYRQVAVVDGLGHVAVHTGERCIAFAGDQSGEQFSAQANMMASPDVWPAMAYAFESAPGGLARRLVAALHAAEAHGGDVRGRQSAALLVVPASGAPWEASADLRVDDHEEPLAELDRLLDLQDAYDLANEGDELAGAGRHVEAGDRYTRASALAPDNHELLFWAGLAAAQAGDMPTALTRVRRAIELRPSWRELLDRLGPDIAPSAAAVRDALG